MSVFMSQILDFYSSQRCLVGAFHFECVSDTQVKFKPSINDDFSIQHFTCYLNFFYECLAQPGV